MSFNEWTVGKLDDIADVIMGQSPAGITCNESNDGFPLLNGPTEFGPSFPKPIQFTTDPKKFAFTNDLLFCVRGSTTGKMNWANQKYAIGRGLAAIRHKKGSDLQPFLKAIIYFNLPTLLAEATGSTFPNVSSQQLKELKIIIPQLHTQRRIASIFSALDDKIELNRQTNQTLEAIAQALFKEWFVYFNFPGVTGDMQGSDLGDIPKGWRVGNLGDILNFKNGKSSPERNNNFKYPVYGANGIIGYSKSFNSNVKNIVIGRVGSYCGAVYYIVEKSFITENAIVAESKYRNSSMFCCITLQNLKLNNFRVGSGQPLLNQTILSSIKIPVPSVNVIERFEEVTYSLYSTIYENENQNSILMELRDTLLPKLMKGEIKIK